MNIPAKLDKFSRVQVGDVLRSYVQPNTTAVVRAKTGTHISLRYVRPAAGTARDYTFNRKAFLTSQWLPMKREAEQEAT